MIEALTVADLRAAHARLTPGGPLDLDERKVDYVIRSHQRLLADMTSQDDHVVIQELGTQLIVVCAALDMLRGDLDLRLGLHVAERWMERNGYLVMPGPYPHDKLHLFETLTTVPKLPENPHDDHLDAVRTWLARNTVKVATGTTLARRAGDLMPDRLPRCFVACPLTGLPAEAMPSTKQLCDGAASVLSEYGLSSMQPALYTDPEVTPIDINDPIYRSIDEHLIAHSDLVLIMAPRRSFGLGVVANMAQRYGKPLLFATADAVVSPMIAGLDPAPSVLDLWSIEEELRHLLDMELQGIASRLRESQRTLTAVAQQLDEIRCGIAHENPQKLLEPSRVTMSRSRFQELLGCPEMFAGATVLEVQQLRGLAGC